jgi:molybdate transport system substrate-binding protein
MLFRRNTTMLRIFAACMLIAGCLVGGGGAASAQTLTVFAAASLTDAMKDIDKVWRQGGHPPLRMNFAASSTLARQIEQGAPANLFASADETWMDWMQQRNLIAKDTRRDVLGNALVMVAPKDHARPVTIGAGFDLLGLLGQDGRLAVGDPSNVPAGIYAQQALTRLGLWQSVQPRLARADSVRSALLLVERGEAPAGVVYATDAAVSPGVTVIGTFPETSHDPITYPFAVTQAGDSKDSRALLDYLDGPAAAAAFKARGFTLLAH